VAAGSLDKADSPGLMRRRGRNLCEAACFSSCGLEGVKVCRLSVGREHLKSRRESKPLLFGASSEEEDNAMSGTSEVLWYFRLRSEGETLGSVPGNWGKGRKR
jgi:hypothetical protein